MAQLIAYAADGGIMAVLDKRVITAADGTIGIVDLETRFGGYQPVGRDEARRPRTTPSPLDRDAWLASFATRG